MMGDGCIICGKGGAYPPERRPPIILCVDHYMDIFQGPDFVDDLARTIYMEYLMETESKKKLK